MTCPLCAEDLPPGTAPERCPACGSRLADPAPPPVRPEIVTVVAALHLLAGAGVAVWIPIDVFLLAHRAFVIVTPPGRPLSLKGAATELAAFALLATLSLATGIGLLHLRPWARPLAVACTLIVSAGLVATGDSVMMMVWLPIAALLALFTRSSRSAFEQALRRR